MTATDARLDAAAYRTARDALMHRLHRYGWSYAEVAGYIGMQVKAVREKLEKDASQPMPASDNGMSKCKRSRS